MEWMKSLPLEIIETCPISALAIPGSHDSGSYWLDMYGPFAPDQTRWLSRILAIFPWIARPIVYRWSITQVADFKNQLELGIRYLDLRISSGPGPNQYSVVHGLFGINIENCLQTVWDFSNSHPSEIIILDFNHLYAMVLADHQALVELVIKHLGDRLVPPQPLEMVTLASLWGTKGRVICIYQNDIARDPKYSIFIWPSETIKSPWPNVANSQQLLHCLDQRYQCGPPPLQSFYVTQGVITPDAPLIVRHPFSSLRDFMAVEVTKELLQWVDSRRAGNWFHIVIADFAETAEFCQAIISLNTEKIRPLSPRSATLPRNEYICSCRWQSREGEENTDNEHGELCPVSRKRDLEQSSTRW
ncbi:hypothetical protein RvY_05492 [Ramazzottius varieornatus]|uniref:Phosphatidylinositol-specific phospholipase C X domain-containing protein n=1 Tax=Ramazzottius varieornatus TaxID=947166 RepID=A0A1D1V1W1_RAMVA|nr:hypothetical protein RvY_05492 [Ramazzottius varieornatus]